MDVLIMKMIGLFIASFVLTQLIIPLLCKIAYKYNFLDRPDGVIKKHNQATPYLGGVAVFCGTLVPSILCICFSWELVWFFLGFFLLLLVGLIDDFVSLKPYQKFFGQCVAVVSFLFGGFYVHISITHNILLSLVLSAFYMLTVINAFNLIDVMDGLATTVALTSSVGFAALALCGGCYSILFIFTAFIGALLAFLIYNWPPARIYLGDAGSLCMGGLLACLPFGIDFCRYGLTGYLVPMFILSIPLIEVVSLIIIRVYKRIPFYQGSPDHFYMYLRIQGWSKRGILFYVGGMTLLATSISLCVMFGLLYAGHLYLFATTFLLFWVVILFLKPILRMCRRA